MYTMHAMRKKDAVSVEQDGIARENPSLPSRLNRRSARLREVAYHAIKDAILNGTVGPDAPLVEERLALILQISRTPVREALAILEHEGLIESLPYKGMFVREVTLEEFLLMYQTVEVIEPALARLAAERVQDRDIAELGNLLSAAERRAPDDVVGFLAACREFQRHVGRCAENPYLTSMLLSIEEHSDLYLLHVNAQQPLDPDKMRAAIRDRRTILDALAERNPEGAARMAQDHAEAVRARWRDIYSVRGAPESTIALT